MLLERDVDVQNTLINVEKAAQSRINRFFAMKKSNEKKLDAHAEEKRAELDVISESVYTLEEEVLALAGFYLRRNHRPDELAAA